MTRFETDLRSGKVLRIGSYRCSIEKHVVFKHVSWDARPYNWVGYHHTLGFDPNSVACALEKSLAALDIQRVWRGYKARRIARAMKNYAPGGFGAIKAAAHFERMKKIMLQ